MAGSGAKQVAYSEIALEIRNDLHRGKYAPGQRMPTLVVLAAKYGVSHSTVRLAFKKLAADGLLEVHQGRGTFVASPKLPYNPTRTFIDQFDAQGHSVRVELIETGWKDPHRNAAEILQIPSGEQVWSVFLLYRLGNMASLADVVDLPRHIAEPLLGDSRKAQSIYRVLREEMGYSNLQFQIRRIDLMSERYYDDIFDTPSGTAFYEIRRAVYCDDVPLTMSFVGIRSDKFHLDLVGVDRTREGRVAETDSAQYPGWKEQMHERFTEITS